MGALTSKERKALDDIFLSINRSNSLYHIIKHNIIIFNKWLKHAKVGAKKSKFYRFLLVFTKKKNSLSK